MPRVGSSRNNTFGFVSNHLPSTTFVDCPPESVPVTVIGEFALMRGELIAPFAAIVSRVRWVRTRPEIDLRSGESHIVKYRVDRGSDRNVAVLGHKSDSVRDRILRGADARRFAINLDLPRIFTLPRGKYPLNSSVRRLPSDPQCPGLAFSDLERNIVHQLFVRNIG